MSHSFLQDSDTVASRLLRRIGIFARKRGEIVFLSRHMILDDIAADLAGGLSSDFNPDGKIVVFCGIHKFFGPDVFRRGFRIGIQTEHYYDESGAMIGRRKWEIPQVLRFVRRCDAILEMSPGNRPIYEQLSEKEQRKIVYGPYIFPKLAADFNEHPGRQAAFFGTLSDRRRKILGQLDPDRFSHIAGGRFGTELLAALDGYRAILNIHFSEGLYTEAPRLLLALKAGKPLVSERLSSEFEPGVHYVLPQDFAPDLDLEPIYAAMAETCCGRYSFQGFLERVLPR